MTTATPGFETPDERLPRTLSPQELEAVSGGYLSWFRIFWDSGAGHAGIYDERGLVCRQLAP